MDEKPIVPTAAITSEPFNAEPLYVNSEGWTIYNDGMKRIIPGTSEGILFSFHYALPLTLAETLMVIKHIKDNNETLPTHK